MKARIAVAVVGVPLLLVILFFLPDFVLTLSVSVMSVMGVHEALASTGMVKKKRIYYYGMIFAAFVPLWFRWSRDTMAGACAILVLICLVYAEALASGGAVKTYAVTGTLFFSLLIPAALSSFVRLRQSEVWEVCIVLPVAIAFISDAGGLFAGMLFGKHKLAPQVSPKKTMEGAIGGLVFAIVAAIATGLIVPAILAGQSGAGAIGVNFVYLAIYGALGSVISQFGDLCFSYVKREYAIKDFGTLFPGHGGVLDRFDSVIFCAPLCEILFVLLPAVWRQIP